MRTSYAYEPLSLACASPPTFPLAICPAVLADHIFRNDQSHPKYPQSDACISLVTFSISPKHRLVRGPYDLSLVLLCLIFPSPPLPKQRCEVLIPISSHMSLLLNTFRAL